MESRTSFKPGNDSRLFIYFNLLICLKRKNTCVSLTSAKVFKTFTELVFCNRKGRTTANDNHHHGVEILEAHHLINVFIFHILRGMKTSNEIIKV